MFSQFEKREVSSAASGEIAVINPEKADAEKPLAASIPFGKLVLIAALGVRGYLPYSYLTRVLLAFTTYPWSLLAARIDAMIEIEPIMGVSDLSDRAPLSRSTSAISRQV